MIINPTVNIINVNHNYIKINEEYINKKDEISNNYYKTLLYIVNTNETDDIDYIISHINEYILKIILFKYRFKGFL
jgi:hypothetical protein